MNPNYKHNNYNLTAKEGISYVQRLLMKRTIGALLIFVSCSLISCVKDFDISIKPNNPQLVIEAYINNEMAAYNYVILSRSLSYLDSNFNSTAVTGARVFITEGTVINKEYKWDPSTKVQLLEPKFAAFPADLKTGIYFDPRLESNPQHALLGAPGKSYLLEISEGDNQYSSVATLLQPVTVDSLTYGFRYVDEGDSSKIKFRVTTHYKDPDTLNNSQFYYYRFSENRNSFGWGALSKSRSPGTDELSNGEYIHLTHPRGFVMGDTVNYSMASVTRDVYNFWDSYNKARDNNGPFATPVSLQSNITGPNVTGCFSGLSLSSKTLIIR